MREADFTQTPGRRRSAWIRTSSELRSATQNQNGNFMPPGRLGMPAVILPIFSAEVSSALRTAALNAAATRSSSMSLSSASRLVSMVTRLTSCLQVISTLTRPAPDSPSTSTFASSSCAFLRLSCMAWACFMRPASCPLLNMEYLSFGMGRVGNSEGFDAAGHDTGVELAHHGLHERVVHDNGLCPLLAGILGGGIAARRAVDHHAQDRK